MEKYNGIFLTTQIFTFDSSSEKWVDSENWMDENLDILSDAMDDLNKMLQKNGRALVNDLFYKLGLPVTKRGCLDGWNYEKMGRTDIEYVAEILEKERAIKVTIKIFVNIYRTFPN